VARQSVASRRAHGQGRFRLRRNRAGPDDISPSGRLCGFRPWQSFNGGAGTAAVTTWNYDAYRGWLLAKDYANLTTGAAGTDGPNYTYSDTTGGRTSAVRDYSANQLNQYETRTVRNKLDILSVANLTQQVEVWKDSDSPSTATRSGEYFHHALTVAYSSYPEVRAKSLFVPNQQASAGRSFVPPTTEQFFHDLDGNLIQDGRWTAYVWDGENRLIEMKRDTETPTEARQRLTFEYDHLGRRVRKRYFTHNGTGWSEQRVTTYLYDGQNLVAELDGNNANATLRTYVWGTDLSGNRSGTGGVGGLLWVNNSQTTGDLPTGIHFVAYDGNGNVSGLTSATDGINTARYEYGPFGEPLRTTGPLAAANPIRWSTKVTDDESGLVYFGYRYYNSSTGRWLSRDPIGILGGPNLNAFVSNEGLSSVDLLGLFTIRRPDAAETSEYFDSTLSFSSWPWWSLGNMQNPLLVPSKGIEVDVEPCQVVLFIGHNDEANPIRFYGPKCEKCCSGSSWRAGFAGCFAAKVNGSPAGPGSTPPKDVVTGSPQWSGSVTVPGGFWSSKSSAANGATAMDSQNPEGPFGPGVDSAILGARNDARAMAKAGCCKVVKLSIVYYDNNGFGWTDGGRMSRYYKIMRHLRAFYVSESEGPLQEVVE
jgi:RHS repeat-associated protein